MGPRIKEARNEAGLTMEGLAEKLDLSKQTVKEWEAGRRQPTVDNLRQLAGILGKSPGWFLDDSAFHDVARVTPSNPPVPTEERLLAMLERQQGLLSEQISASERQRHEAHLMLERQRQDIANLTDAIKVQQHAFLQEREFQQKLSLKRDETIDELRAEVDALKAQLRTPSRGRQQLLDAPVRPGRTGAQ